MLKDDPAQHSIEYTVLSPHKSELTEKDVNFIFISKVKKTKNSVNYRLRQEYIKQLVCNKRLRVTH